MGTFRKLRSQLSGMWSNATSNSTNQADQMMRSISMISSILCNSTDNDLTRSMLQWQKYANRETPTASQSRRRRSAEDARRDEQGQFMDIFEDALATYKSHKRKKRSTNSRKRARDKYKLPYFDYNKINVKSSNGLLIHIDVDATINFLGFYIKPIKRLSRLQLQSAVTHYVCDFRDICVALILIRFCYHYNRSFSFFCFRVLIIENYLDSKLGGPLLCFLVRFHYCVFQMQSTKKMRRLEPLRRTFET